MSAWHGIIGQAFTPVGFIAYVHGLQFGSWRPSFVVLHNTAIPTFASWHNAPGSRRMKALEEFYRDVQKWSGGPHLFVADDVIWVFNPLTLPGVHSPSWNGVSWGVEMVGDYNTEPLNPMVLQNTASALATLHDVMGLDPATLRLHREDPKTTHKGCPGKAVIKSQVIELVEYKIAKRHEGEHSPEAER